MRRVVIRDRSIILSTNLSLVVKQLLLVLILLLLFFFLFLTRHTFLDPQMSL